MSTVTDEDIIVKPPLQRGGGKEKYMAQITKVKQRVFEPYTPTPSYVEEVFNNLYSDKRQFESGAAIRKY